MGLEALLIENKLHFKKKKILIISGPFDTDRSENIPNNRKRFGKKLQTPAIERVDLTRKPLISMLKIKREKKGFRIDSDPNMPDGDAARPLSNGIR